MRVLAAVLNAIILLLTLVVNGVCCYNNAVMNAKITALETAQAKQSADVRQVKTDGEIILRLVTGGDFIRRELE